MSYTTPIRPPIRLNKMLESRRQAGGVRVSIKVNSVSTHDMVRLLDGRVRYIGFTVTRNEAYKGSVSPRLADDLASIVSKSKPVLVFRRHSIIDMIEVLDEASTFKIAEYRIPVPPQTASIIASRLAEKGINMAPLVIWDNGWKPASPCKYIDFSRTIAGVELEYVIVKPGSLMGKGPSIPLRELQALECIGSINLGDHGVTRDNICSLVDSGVGLVDIEMGGEHGATRRDVLDIVNAVSRCPVR